MESAPAAEAGSPTAPSPAAAATQTTPAEAPAGTLADPDVSAQRAEAAVPPQQVRGSSETPLRRGLPRVPGGEPWPPEGFAPLAAEPEEAASIASPAQTPEPAAAARTARETAEPAPAATPAPMAADQAQTPESSPPIAEQQLPGADAAPAPVAAAPRAEPQKQRLETAQPEPVAPTPAAKSAADAKPQRQPVMLGSKSLGQWATLIGLITVGGILAAGILILAARGVTTLPGVPEFMERYTGVYEIPDVAEEGLPWWARWAHYLNFFFLLLIIRTGLLVRTQQKPDAFYTPKKGGKKVSIYLWLHTSVDILWLLNGLIFVVTLFATGHWQRVVPTSWEVFPNAASALLQYMTLEWPTYESGWVYYNSLQELMYFAVIFIAAPLAVITGVRMSEWWPKNIERLNRIYPAGVARALHFPVMLFFVLFIIMHVVLVFATGALENLNHMFYGADEPSWMGFWFFAGGLVLAIAAVAAARPLLIAPVASLFGRVSNR